MTRDLRILGLSALTWGIGEGMFVYFLPIYMQERLPSVTAPVLIIHSKRDRSVSEEHPEKIYKKLKTKRKSILWLDNSGHVITLDAEKDRVFQAVADFIQGVVVHKDM